MKFRIGRIVYLDFSRDETIMGFALPKEWREVLIECDPEKFLMPRTSDLRYNWACVRLAAIDEAEMRELVLDAWAFVVPKKVVAEYSALNAALTCGELATRDGVDEPYAARSAQPRRDRHRRSSRTFSRRPASASGRLSMSARVLPRDRPRTRRAPRPPARARARRRRGARPG